MEASGRARFIQEASAASALNTEKDGQTFIVMVLVDGKPLQQLIPRKAMRLTEAQRWTADRVPSRDRRERFCRCILRRLNSRPRGAPLYAGSSKAVWFAAEGQLCRRGAVLQAFMPVTHMDCENRLTPQSLAQPGTRPPHGTVLC